MKIKYKFRGMVMGTLLITVSGQLMAQTIGPEKPDTTTVHQKLNTGEYVPGRLFNVPKNLSTGAVSSVTGDVLKKTPVPNLTNTLYGRLVGLTVSQGSGEPGNDNARLAIRGAGSYFGNVGSSPYGRYRIFVDGFEVNANYLPGLSAAEIQEVSVLKDAASLATLGLRGANGVIYITTKRGSVGKPTVSIQARTGIQQAININKPLNSYNYANLYNQALYNDNGGNLSAARYSPAQLAAYQNGTAPNVDWYDRVLKKNGMYTDADVTFSGGDSTTRYNIVLNYANQGGLYDVKNTDATSNEGLTRYNVRTNLDFTLLKIVDAKFDLGGRIEDLRHPNIVAANGGTLVGSTSNLFNQLAGYPSNIYNPYADANNTLYSGTTLYPYNPLASVQAQGYGLLHTRILQGNFTFKERLDGLTPGLYLKEAFSVVSYYQSFRSKNADYVRYFDYANNPNPITNNRFANIRATGASPIGQQDWKQAMATIGYDRKFGDHQLFSALNYHLSDYRGDGYTSFVYRYQNLSGRANYSYKNRYVGEFGFSYFGTDAFAPGHRWGFYPAVSGAWIVSNESFLQNNATLSYLKLRASVGKTGNQDSDAGLPIGGQNGRLLYQQYYASAGTFYLGDGTISNGNTLRSFYIPNENVKAETSMKYNLGIDFKLMNKLDVSLDAYLDKRSNILTVDNSIPRAFGNNLAVNNIGRQTSKGFEATASYSDKIGKVGISLSGLAAYTKNKLDYISEVAPAYAYNAATGRPLGTIRGLVAAGYYQLNDFNADGSLKAGQAVPQFGKVQPGDLKYQDLDQNGKVDANDITAIGKSVLPEFTYAFGFNVDYKGFDLGTYFQGVSGTSVNIIGGDNSLQTVAFVNNGNAYAIAQGAWAYYPTLGIDTRATATYPRLTTTTNSNNYQTSSFWIKSGDYLRIRNVELGYTFSARVAGKLGLSKLRIFVNAVNPVTWSSLLRDYHMDPEVPNGYPPLKSFNTGVTVSF
jgi:TonB-linked SusC/RagA family outer membrane protein